MKTLSVNIPFQGFYYSWYSDALDREQESYADYYIQDAQEREDTSRDLRLTESEVNEILSDVTDWPKAQEMVAECYTDYFFEFLSEETGINIAHKYEVMTSPREYNFATDRIFADVSWFSLARLFVLSKQEDHKRLRATIELKCTSRSGFISFYSSNIDTWLKKPLADWDHNELSMLIRAFLPENWDDDVFDSFSNGDCAYSAWETSVDWQAFETKASEARENKLKKLQSANLGFVPAIPRCPKTLDLFNDNQ